MAIIKGDDSDNNNLVGTGGDDKIYGYGGDDVLDGGDGNDVLYAGAGNDTLIGGAGNDQLSGGEGADKMTGGIGNDTYYVDDIGDQVIEIAGEGTDTVVSTISFDLRRTVNIEHLMLSGTDNISGHGNALDNTIKGNVGNNNISGGDGNDSINGGDGNDIIDGGRGNDYLIGGDGTDTVTFKATATSGVTVSLEITNVRQNTGGAGNDFITGFENLEGSLFSDRLTGNSGDNKISALSGDDWIRGLSGNDDITAGDGADTIHFEGTGSNGVDRIRGFTSGVDKLEFNAADGYDAGAGFTVGKTAVGSDAQFVYDSQLDTLSYDADGDGAGAAVLLANLANLTTKLTSADIVIIP